MRDGIRYCSSTKIEIPNVSKLDLRVLLGRSNYLCRSKWQEFIPRIINEFRVGAISAIWLSEENSGDRSEINFKGLEKYFYRISRYTLIF